MPFVEHFQPRLVDLPRLFRTKAAGLREDGGADKPARAWERAADLLEEAIATYMDEPLSIEEAATESGYTLGHLRRLVREGTIPVLPNRTIRRRHTPRKPGVSVATPPHHRAFSGVQLARAVVEKTHA